MSPDYDHWHSLAGSCLTPLASSSNQHWQQLPVILLVMLAIERMGATMTAQTGMVGPMSTIIMGVLILGEPFTPWVVVGTLLVLTGVWLLARWR